MLRKVFERLIRPPGLPHRSELRRRGLCFFEETFSNDRETMSHNFNSEDACKEVGDGRGWKREAC
jgi:hypothetical protein